MSDGQSDQMTRLLGKRDAADWMTLASGKEIWVNCGILGIAADGTLYSGYDGKIDFELNPEERVEVLGIINERCKEAKNAPE